MLKTLKRLKKRHWDRPRPPVGFRPEVRAHEMEARITPDVYVWNGISPLNDTDSWAPWWKVGNWESPSGVPKLSVPGLGDEVHFTNPGALRDCLIQSAPGTSALCKSLVISGSFTKTVCVEGGSMLSVVGGWLDLDYSGNKFCVEGRLSVSNCEAWWGNGGIVGGGEVYLHNGTNFLVGSDIASDPIRNANVKLLVGMNYMYDSEPATVKIVAGFDDVVTMSGAGNNIIVGNYGLFTIHASAGGWFGASGGSNYVSVDGGEIDRAPSVYPFPFLPVVLENGYNAEGQPRESDSDLTLRGSLQIDGSVTIAGGGETASLFVGTSQTAPTYGRVYMDDAVHLHAAHNVVSNKGRWYIEGGFGSAISHSHVHALNWRMYNGDVYLGVLDSTTPGGPAQFHIDAQEALFDAGDVGSCVTVWTGVNLNESGVSNKIINGVGSIRFFDATVYISQGDTTEEVVLLESRVTMTYPSFLLGSNTGFWGCSVSQIEGTDQYYLRALHT